jgi:catechol 2,3-dioxygenase-like lactoylglutathione lyase family enzyme
MRIDLVSLIVRDYDEAIAFFVDDLGFDLVEDSASVGGDGRAKRWVVVRPPGGVSGLLLAEANGEDQRAAVGAQFAGRVGLFLRVEDFDRTFASMSERGVHFVVGPRVEPYGRIAIFVDVAGNKWDLIGPL